MNAFGCCLQQRLSWDIVFEASDTAKPFELLHVAVRQIPRSVVPTTIFTFIWVCEHCNMAIKGRARRQASRTSVWAWCQKPHIWREAQQHYSAKQYSKIPHPASITIASKLVVSAKA